MILYFLLCIVWMAAAETCQEENVGSGDDVKAYFYLSQYDCQNQYNCVLTYIGDEGECVDGGDYLTTILECGDEGYALKYIDCDDVCDGCVEDVQVGNCEEDDGVYIRVEGCGGDDPDPDPEGTCLYEAIDGDDIRVYIYESESDCNSKWDCLYLFGLDEGCFDDDDGILECGDSGYVKSYDCDDGCDNPCVEVGEFGNCEEDGEGSFYYVEGCDGAGSDADGSALNDWNIFFL